MTMTKIIKHIFLITGKISAVLVQLKIIGVLKSVLDQFYTGYIKRNFGSFGHSTVMYRLYTFIGGEYISVGDDTIIEKGVQLTAYKTTDKTPEIIIGNGCLIRKDSHITATCSVKIGNGLLTGTNVFITDNSHGLTDYESLTLPPRQRPIAFKGPVAIGNNVWLGNNVCVLSGCSIGDGAVVGANSVVTHDIPPYCVATGIPAKVIKTNFIERQNESESNRILSATVPSNPRE